MKYCIHCGTQLEDDANFCTNCGQTTDAPDAAPAVEPVSAEPAVAESTPIESTPVEPAPAFAPDPAPAPAFTERVEPQGNYQQPNTQPVYTQQSTVQSAPAARPSIAKPIVGLALGIAGLCLSIILGLYGPFGLIGIGVSIAGIVVSSKAKVTNPGSNMANHGFRLSLAGIIVGGILTIIFSIIWAAVGHSIFN